jgi:hypothetical protein
MGHRDLKTLLRYLDLVAHDLKAAHEEHSVVNRLIV